MRRTRDSEKGQEDLFNILPVSGFMTQSVPGTPAAPIKFLACKAPAATFRRHSPRIM
jgi:hypothetical protein